MAFLIFLRENLLFQIYTPELVINAKWIEDNMIGQTMSIEYSINDGNREVIGFDTYSDTYCDTYFECPKTIYNEFIDSVIKEEDIIYRTYLGDIVSRKAGNIYSGNLFVCHIDKLSNSYNIKPENLPLDRDRSIPQDFHIEYYTSRINERYNKSLDNRERVTNEQLEGKDYTYVNELPESVVNQFVSKNIGKEKVYINKIDNKPIQSRRITDILNRHPKFIKSNQVSDKQKLKYKVEATNKKSIKTLLKNFKTNHCISKDSKEDITIIINRYNKEINCNKQFKNY